MAHSGSHHRPPMQFNFGNGHQVTSWPSYNNTTGGPSSDRLSAPQLAPSSLPHFTPDERLMYPHLYHPSAESFQHVGAHGFNSVPLHPGAPHMAQPVANSAMWSQNSFQAPELVASEQEKESRLAGEPSGPTNRPVFLFSPKQDTAPRSLLIHSSRRQVDRSPSPAAPVVVMGGSDTARASPLTTVSHSYSSTSSPAPHRSPASTPRATANHDVRAADASLSSVESHAKSPRNLEGSNIPASSAFALSSKDHHHRHTRNILQPHDLNSVRSPQNTTLIPVNLFPALYHDLLANLEELSPDDYDPEALQTLIMESSMIEGDQDLEGDDQTRQALLLQNCIATVLADTRYTYKKSPLRDEGSIEDREAAEALIRDLKVAERYNALMNGVQYQIQRLYRNSDTNASYVWTREDFRRLKEAFQRFGYAPSANRQVADFVGKGMHSNHIQYFKRALRQRFGGDQVQEIVASDGYDALLAAAPEDDGRELLDFLPEVVNREEILALGAKNVFDASLDPSLLPSATLSSKFAFDGTSVDRASQATSASSPAPGHMAVAPAPVPKRRGRPPKAKPTAPAPPASDTPNADKSQSSSSGPPSDSTSTSTMMDVTPQDSSPMAVGFAPFNGSPAPSNLPISSLPPSKSFLNEMAVHGLTEEDFRMDASPSPSGAAQSSDTGSSSSYTQNRDAHSDSTLDGESPTKRRMLSENPFGAAHATGHMYQPRVEARSKNASTNASERQRPNGSQMQPQESMQSEWSQSLAPGSTASSNAPMLPHNANNDASSVFQNLGMPPQLEASLGRGEDSTSQALAWLMQRTSEITSAIQAIASQQKPASQVPTQQVSNWSSQADFSPPSSQSQQLDSASNRGASPYHYGRSAPTQSQSTNSKSAAPHSGTATLQQLAASASPKTADAPLPSSPSTFSVPGRSLPNSSSVSASPATQGNGNGWHQPSSLATSSSSAGSFHMPTAGSPNQQAASSATVPRWNGTATLQNVAPSLPLQQQNASRTHLTQPPRNVSPLPTHPHMQQQQQYGSLPMNHPHALANALSQAGGSNMAQLQGMPPMGAYPFHNPQHGGTYGLQGGIDARNASRGVPLQYPIASILDPSLSSSIPPNRYNNLDQAPQR